MIGVIVLPYNTPIFELMHTYYPLMEYSFKYFNHFSTKISSLAHTFNSI